MNESLSDNDFITIENFDLKWRFTETKHHLLPSQDLSFIKPLSRSKAKVFNKISLQYLGNACLLESKFDQIDALNPAKDYETVKLWLHEKSLNPESEIIVSWDNSNCVITNWGIFCKYWAAFCYPSSDDILIWSSLDKWMLYYCHEEILEFGYRKA